MVAFLIVAVPAFLVIGLLILVRKRNEIRRAMLSDGFAPHEMRKALRLFDRKKYAEMAIYCREVIDRKALAGHRDWTDISSYQKLPNRGE